MLANYDLIFISETWRNRNPYDHETKSRKQGILENAGFVTIEFPRQTSVLGKPGRGHGGIFVAIRKKLFHKIELIDQFSNSEIVWFKFKEGFLTHESRTIFLCFCYLAPIGSLW